MEDGRQDSEDTALVFGAEVKYFHGAEEPAEVLPIIFANNLTVSTLATKKSIHEREKQSNSSAFEFLRLLLL